MSSFGGWLSYDNELDGKFDTQGWDAYDGEKVKKDSEKAAKCTYIIAN